MFEGLKLKLLSRMVEESGPLHTPCWIWAGGTSDYGTIWWEGRPWSVHRASWLVHVGPIPDGLCVCHKCDVKRCINPTHLFIGTDQDNVDDWVAKGHHRNGKGRPRLVTPEQTTRMAVLREQGHSYAAIGTLFGVSGWTVSRSLSLSKIP